MSKEVLNKSDLKDALIGEEVEVINEKNVSFGTNGEVSGIDGEYVTFKSPHLMYRLHYSELAVLKSDEKPVAGVVTITKKQMLARAQKAADDFMYDLPREAPNG